MCIRDSNIAVLTDRDPMEAIEKARAIGPGVYRHRALYPCLPAVDCVIEGIATDDPSFLRVEELDSLEIIARHRRLKSPTLPAVGGVEDLAADVDRPSIEQVGEPDRAHREPAGRGDGLPVKATVS